MTSHSGKNSRISDKSCSLLVQGYRVECQPLRDIRGVVIVIVIYDMKERDTFKYEKLTDDSICNCKKRKIMLKSFSFHVIN